MHVPFVMRQRLVERDVICVATLGGNKYAKPTHSDGPDAR
jgi:hypothetical protein